MTSQNLETLSSVLDAKGGIPSRIDVDFVARVFAGVYFRGIGNIIDSEAFQTGMRHIELDPRHRVFEFDVWYDKKGERRRKFLRTEIGDFEQGEPVAKYNYEPDADGVYVLVVDDKREK